MKTQDFDKMEVYARQARELYGNTPAYEEYTRKAKTRSPQEEKELGAQVMDFFVRLGKLRPIAPDSREALTWAEELQAFLTAHYYTCTPHIFKCLAESYAWGGSMTENIDQAAGVGTGAFAKQVIDAYLDQKQGDTP